MQYTSKYSLSQWDKSDRIQMEDFNADNLKVEQALSSLQSGLSAEQTTRGTALSAEAAARTAGDLYVKLLDETLTADTQKWDLSLSGIDLSQYQKLMLYPRLKGNDTQWVYIRVNGLTTGYSTPNNDPTNAGNVPMMNDPTRQNFGFCEYTWLIELPRIYCVQTGTTTTHSRPGVTGAELPPLADGVTRLETLNLWYSSANQRILSGSRVTIYGLKR